jgi:hypothetical protein
MNGIILIIGKNMISNIKNIIELDHHIIMKIKIINKIKILLKKTHIEIVKAIFIRKIQTIIKNTNHIEKARIINNIQIKNSL